MYYKKKKKKQDKRKTKTRLFQELGSRSTYLIWMNFSTKLIKQEELQDVEHHVSIPGSRFKLLQGTSVTSEGKSQFPPPETHCTHGQLGTVAMSQQVPSGLQQVALSLYGGLGDKGRDVNPLIPSFPWTPLLFSLSFSISHDSLVADLGFVHIYS